MEEELKLVFAHFGRAMYVAAYLEHEMVNVLCLLEIIPSPVTAKDRETHEKIINDHYETCFEKTMGVLKNKLKNHSKEEGFEEEIQIYLDKAVDERNYLAHRFFRENAYEILSENGRSQMIRKCEFSEAVIEYTDNKLVKFRNALSQKYGITEQSIEIMYEKLKNELGIS